MEFKEEIYYSVCGVANELLNDEKGKSNIDITFRDTLFSLKERTFIRDRDDVYPTDRIQIDLTNYQRLGIMLTIPSDFDEIYFIKKIHKIICDKLMILNPELKNEDTVLYYKYRDNHYPLLIEIK